MTWSKRMKHPSKLVNVGDQVECVVLNANPTERRISLGTPAGIESLGQPHEKSRWARRSKGAFGQPDRLRRLHRD
jgi:ribosomal protein S1